MEVSLALRQLRCRMAPPCGTVRSKLSVTAKEDEVNEKITVTSIMICLQPVQIP